MIEGSDDGQSWREYVFRYKPGPLTRPPLWNIPHQPRLDWQMWFAALGDAQANPWFQNSCCAARGQSAGAGAARSNPFPDHPPKFVRAKLYDYRFADPRTHAATGQWWMREFEGPYFPSVSLADFTRGETPAIGSP